MIKSALVWSPQLKRGGGGDPRQDSAQKARRDTSVDEISNRKMAGKMAALCPPISRGVQQVSLVNGGAYKCDKSGIVGLGSILVATIGVLTVAD